MDAGTLKTFLNDKKALIVHCTRPGRSGELKGNSLYPEDLRSTIRDLESGSYRNVSCSVVWPEHTDSFGPFGICITPDDVDGLGILNSVDAGFGEAGGDGRPYSAEALEWLFNTSMTGKYNEWVIRSGTVSGIWINRGTILEVATHITADQLASQCPDTPRQYLEDTIASRSITLDEIARDFPTLPIIAFEAGDIVTLRQALETSSPPL